MRGTIDLELCLKKWKASSMKKIMLWKIKEGPGGWFMRTRKKTDLTTPNLNNHVLL